MTWTRQLGWALGAGTLLLSAHASYGCDNCGGVSCGACPPAFTLYVTDADTGQPVSDVHVAGAEAYCEVEAALGYTSCEVELTVGNFDLTLSADGYDDLPLSVTINPDSGESCCGCGYNAKRRDVAMTPS